MSYRFAALLGVCLFCHAGVAQANVTAEQWQQQLQADLDVIDQRSSMLSIEGPVKVEQQEGGLLATLPILTITAPDASRWSVPGVTLHALSGNAQTGNVTIKLPSRISYRNAAGQEQSAVEIASQSISGTWNFKGSYFETLNGTLGNIQYIDRASEANASIASIALDAANARAPMLTASNVRSKAKVNGVMTGSMADSLTLNYQFADGAKLTLPRVIGLLNPVWLLVDNQDFTIAVNATKFTFSDTLSRVTTMESMASRLQVMPRESGAVLGGRLQVDMKNVTQQPEQMYSFVLPTKATMLGTISNMPLQVLGQPFYAAQKFMVDAGTRADISEIVWNTPDNARLTGTGWLKAAENVPLGVTGRLTLNIENLRALNASLQKRMAMPGADMKTKAQGLVLVMILQGLVKDNGTASEILLDMTPDGQVLVNGQNVTALFAMGGNMGAGLSGAMDGVQSRAAPARN